MEHKGTVVLKSNRLVLRRIVEDDALEIFNGFINQEEFLYYANKKKRTLDEQINSLKNIDDKYLKLDYYNWIITLKDNGAIIGSINLRVEEINETVEFNYVIDNRYTKKGYMTEALCLVKDFCLNELLVNRFQGGCCVENIASYPDYMVVGIGDLADTYYTYGPLMITGEITSTNYAELLDKAIK